MEREGLARVKMFVVITVAYLIFWGPLFLVTLFSYGDYKTETPSTSHEVTLHVAFVHAFVNPTLFLVSAPYNFFFFFNMCGIITAFIVLIYSPYLIIFVYGQPATE